MIQTYPAQRDRFKPKTSVFLRSDLDSVAPFTTSVSGTSASVVFTTAAIAETNRFGIATLTQGTTTTGRASVGSATADSVIFNAGATTLCAAIKTPANLSDGTNRYSIQVGFTNAFASLSPTISAQLRYRDNNNSGKWQAYCSENVGGSSTADTGITVAANTWYTLEIRLARSGGPVQFYINGSLVATISGASVPTGSSNPCGIFCGTVKALGTTARPMYADFLTFEQEVAR